MTKKTIGLLVMSFGTARSFEGLEDYYTRICHGNKPSTEQLIELTARFKMIGLSPLNEITIAQGEELAQQLNSKQSEIEFKLYVGFQHVAPFIGDVVRQIHEDGIREVVAVAMAPHYSKFSAQVYHNLALEAAAEFGDMTFTDIKEWWRNEEFTRFWVENINAELATIPEAEQDETIVILSAHSLPQKLMAIENLYEQQVSESEDLIISKSNSKNMVKAWQSEGANASPEAPWLGPDVQDITRSLYAENGFKHFIYAPIGFTAEHLEVFFDNDYECKRVCEEFGATYHRPKMPNSNSLYMSAIASQISKKLGL